MIRKTYARFNEALSGPHLLLNELVESLLSRKPRPAPYQNLRIAVVKQETAAVLYCTEAEASPRELLESCLKHMGPLALATELGAHFPIVKTTDDPDTQAWKEVITEAGHGNLAEYEALRTRPFMDGKRGHQRAPGEFAHPADAIDWSRYDIVISANVSVPERIVRKFPGTTWAYLCDHPVTSTYRRSLNEPLYGYDIFLNIRSRTCRLLPKPNRAHVIDWPFDVLRPGTVAKALGEPAVERRGLFVESHSYQLFSSDQLKRLEKFGPIYRVSPRTIDIARDLTRAKYYVRQGGRLLWGNPQIEGISAGCLFLADPREIINKSLFTRRTATWDFKSLVERLNYFEANPGAYARELEKQERLLEYFCYHRPLLDLWRKHLAVQAARKALGRA